LDNPREAQEVAEFLSAVKEFDMSGTREAIALKVGESLALNGTSCHKEEQ
jgi:hypothetical protein